MGWEKVRTNTWQHTKTRRLIIMKKRNGKWNVSVSKNAMLQATVSFTTRQRALEQVQIFIRENPNG